MNNMNEFKKLVSKPKKSGLFRKEVFVKALNSS
jgi:hypothetical protein